jgi:hypothetical protein
VLGHSKNVNIKGLQCIISECILALNIYVGQVLVDEFDAVRVKSESIVVYGGCVARHYRCLLLTTTKLHHSALVCGVSSQ